MSHGSRRSIRVAVVITAFWVTGGVWAAGQAGQPAPSQRAPLAEEVFKNVRVLRGIPVDEFMGTMGVFSAALGISCGDCHTASDTSWENYALDTGPKKVIARRMVQMVTALNQSSFGGRQVVTCYTCHRGNDRPRVTASLARVYGETPSEEPEDVVQGAAGAPPVDQIFDKYIQALGGRQKLAALTSFVAKGTTIGYGPEGTPRPFEIYAKAPGQRTTTIHTLDGDSVTTFNGGAGWIAAPHKPLPVYPLSKGELAGVRLDAAMSFPAQIKNTLGEWRVGMPGEIDDHQVQVVQGSADNLLATFYFDSMSGLLTRLVRYAESPVGRLPTQIDYSDYRDVAGVKLPFHVKVTWLDGLENFSLTDVQANAAIDAAKFGMPAPARQR